MKASASSWVGIGDGSGAAQFAGNAWATAPTSAGSGPTARLSQSWTAVSRPSAKRRCSARQSVWLATSTPAGSRVRLAPGAGDGGGGGGDPVDPLGAARGGLEVEAVVVRRRPERARRDGHDVLAERVEDGERPREPDELGETRRHRAPL